MIGGFRCILCFGVLDGSLLVTVILMNAAKNAIGKLTFKLQCLRVSEKSCK